MLSVFLRFADPEGFAGLAVGCGERSVEFFAFSSAFGEVGDGSSGGGCGRSATGFREAQPVRKQPSSSMKNARNAERTLA
jgi:hypothetical protein